MAESGLSKPEDLRKLAAAGISSYLIGESLMRADDVETATHALISDIPPMSKLSHIDEAGRASMVDVSGKRHHRSGSPPPKRSLSSPEEAFGLVLAGEIKKGDVLATARIAGIMAAKKTSELIPLCHPLALTHAGVEFTPIPERHAFRIVASAKDHRRPDRRRDGSHDRRQHRGADHLRHGQGGRQRRGHRIHPSADEIGRQERAPSRPPPPPNRRRSSSPKTNLRVADELRRAC